MSLAVEMTGIVKQFGPFVALERVDLAVREGSLHALVGENGAGKTTLMRVLQGLLVPDEGEVKVRGKAVRFKRASDGIAHRIGMVSQHYSILPELTCLQNLMLGCEPGSLLNTREAKVRAQQLANKMGFAFEWDAPAAGLSPAQAQKLEILKLLWRNAEIMILDEPTAMLSPADSDALFESLKVLASEGATIILVTHRLSEVMEHCEAITVLRGGKKVNDRRVDQTSVLELAEMIVGHALAPSVRESFSPGSDVLEVRRLTVRGARGDDALKQVSLTLKAGELVGVAGVDGNGQRELFQAVIGTQAPTAGELRFRGGDWASARTTDRISEGLRIVPEDRFAEGMVAEWSLVDNSGLGLQRLTPFRTGNLRSTGIWRQAAERIAARFGTKHAGIGQRIGALSGGNQQRFVAGRALENEPGLILAFQPVRGLDIDGARQLYDGIRNRCREGAAALVVSFDLDELLEQCDRVVVLNRGVMREPEPGKERDRLEIGRLMVAT